MEEIDLIFRRTTTLKTHLLTVNHSSEPKRSPKVQIHQATQQNIEPYHFPQVLHEPKDPNQHFPEIVPQSQSPLLQKLHTLVQLYHLFQHEHALFGFRSFATKGVRIFINVYTNERRTG